MHNTQAATSEVTILSRILRPQDPTFSAETAQELLGLDFDPADKDRMQALSAKARAGTLTADEDAEARRYELIGHLLNVLQSKARRSLVNRRDGASMPSGTN